jgi:hypothetical protein
LQTFLPYADLRASCAVLDDRRLGKQRVETFQILRALTWPTYAWKNHPAVKMWRGFVPALVAYGLENCREWTRRGHADTVAEQLLAWGSSPSYDLPPWFGLAALHRSHRSALVRKDPAGYGPRFPDVPDDLPYVWPEPLFPRWPVRREADPVGLAEALVLLGYASPLPGQAAAVSAAISGRDVLLTTRPGAGASTAGLLAGLCTGGRTLWLAPPAGPLEPAAPPLAVDHRDLQGVLRAENPRQTSVINRPAGVSRSRQPGPADVLAMQAEQAPSEWVFRRPDEPVSGAFGLIVVDGADALRAWHRAVDAPVVAIVRAADAARPAELAGRLGLRDPAVVDGT